MPPSEFAVAPSPLEADFRPVSLAVMDSAPSPFGRTLLLAICGFTVLALTWSVIGTVDVVAVAQGRIIPTGRVKVVQAPEAGVVRAIHVREGQAVKEGELLIELDPTLMLASADQMRQDLRAAQLDRARLKALSANSLKPETAFKPPDGVSAEQIAIQRRMLRGRADEHKAQVDAASAELARREGERRSLLAQAAKLEASIPLLAERVGAKQTLTDKGYGAAMPLLELKQQLSDQQHDLAILRTRMAEVESGIQAAAAQLRRTRAEFERGVETELAEAEKKVASLRQEMLKAEQRLLYQDLLAPADGVAQQLAVNTVGGVLTQGQTALVVVPGGARLEVEAMVLNKDVGFVQPGQEAVVKLETFNFTRYGSLSGRVLHVSGDAVEDKTFGLAYAARIALDETSMMIDGRRVPLSPGMSATVEIKTEQRRLIEYILTPLLRYKDESLRER